MKSFFKTTLAVIVGTLLTSIFVVIISIITLSIIISAGSKETEVEKNSILMLTFDKPINERASKNPFENFDFANMSSNQSIGLDDILKSIRNAKDDENIKGIYLKLSVVPAGMATLEDIRNALLDYKTSGKFLISHSDGYNQKSYYLASACDKVYLTPTGDFSFLGLSAELMFFKKLLENLGVEPEILRHGKFKSAVEPFMLDKMSDENREQYNTLLGAIWKKYVEGISKTRNISVQDLTEIANGLKVASSKDALQYKFVDALKYKDELIDELILLTEVKEEADLKLITLDKYKNAPVKIADDFKLAKDKIAIVYAQGEITMGSGDDETIGSETISKAIREARKDSSIKAIVLRVNSPGGSALASEIIYREVILAKQVKPVVVSMGDLAASGGYYIACGADSIIAQPNTLTGSIGVFGVLFNAKKLMNEKIGITTDVVKTNNYSDLGSAFRKMVPEEKEFIMKTIEEIYDVFITHVAEGRKMTKQQVDDIGQGRVWSGANAIEIGLIDKFGGINDAIETAKRMAKIEKYRIVALPEQKEPFDEILESFSTRIKTKVINETLGSSYNYYKTIENVLQLDGIQARIPFEVYIH